MSRMEPPLDPATLAADVGGSEAQVDFLLQKHCRAAERNRCLRRKREDYRRWLQGLGSHQVPQDKAPRTSAQRQSKPHRSARALKRTCLAKGSMATCTDVPSVYLGRGGRSRKLARKPSVSPLLSLQQDVSLDQTRCPLEAWMNIVDASAGMDTDEASPSPSEPPEAGSIEKPMQALKEVLQQSSTKAVVAVLPVLLAIELLLTRDSGYSAVFLESEGVQCCLECLRRQFPRKSDPAIARAVCAILANVVARETSGRSLIFACGGIPTLLEAMRRCSASADELAAMNAEMREHLLKESALEMVINAMKNHVQHGRVQIAACGVLRNSSATSDACQSHLAALGAGASHIQTHSIPECFAKDAALQCACCWALFCLSVRKPTLQQELARQGALRATLAAMKSQSAVAKVQEAGCWVLRELASTVQSLSVAIHEHDVPEVQKAGSAARQRLAVRGFRLSQFQTQLVRPSIVKRRRHFASLYGREMHEIVNDLTLLHSGVNAVSAAYPCCGPMRSMHPDISEDNAVEAARLGSRPVSVSRLGPSRFQIAGREVAVQIRNDQVLVQQGQVFVPMAKYLSTIGLVGGTANGSVTPRGSGSGGGTPRSSAAPAASEAQSPQGATTPRSSTGSRTVPATASLPHAERPQPSPKLGPGPVKELRSCDFSGIVLRPPVELVSSGLLQDEPDAADGQHYNLNQPS
eukprot:s5387_g3.t1